MAGSGMPVSSSCQLPFTRPTVAASRWPHLPRLFSSLEQVLFSRPRHRSLLLRLSVSGNHLREGNRAINSPKTLDPASTQAWRPPRWGSTNCRISILLETRSYRHKTAINLLVPGSGDRPWLRELRFSTTLAQINHAEAFILSLISSHTGSSIPQQPSASGPQSRFPHHVTDAIGSQERQGPIRSIILHPTGVPCIDDCNFMDDALLWVPAAKLTPRISTTWSADSHLHSRLDLGRQKTRGADRL
ncbi:hypothetical protein VTI74DRAFT_11387 [Chaetomium olivicolor]